MSEEMKAKGPGKRILFAEGLRRTNRGASELGASAEGPVDLSLSKKFIKKFFTVSTSHLAYLIFQEITRIISRMLTSKQRKFVEHRARGMGRQRSAILAGYKEHESVGKDVESSPSVQEELAKIRAEMANSAGVSKEDIVAMLIDAAALAKLQADPQSIVSAARELGKMLGFYAPEVKKTLHGIDKGELKKALRDMKEEDLYRIAYQGETIDGKAIRVEEKDAIVPNVREVQPE